MSIAPTPFDRVQYTLSHLGTESITIKEIKNWGNDEKEYARNADYDGIFAKFSMLRRAMMPSNGARRVASARLSRAV